MMINQKHALLANSHILIVDDTRLTLNLIRQVLEVENYRVSLLDNGLLAFEQSKRLRPDLILLDIMMPDINGFEVCEQLKQDLETKDIPIIFLTASDNPNNVIRGFELGAVDYLKKPFHLKELLVRVSTQLQLRLNYNNLQDMIQQRNALLHILCHDLANPMQAVISILDIMDEGDDFEQIRALLLSRAKHGLDLIKLVQQMQITENVPLSSVNLKQMINNALAVLDNRFKQKNLRVEVALEPHYWVLAEPVSLLNSVLNNILTNAIKFSYRDSVIKIFGGKQAGGKICLFIRDQGMGILPQKIQSIFEQQGRANSCLGTEGEKGTGFGMFLVNKFMQAYGGDISITSKTKAQETQHYGTCVKLCFLQTTE
jgi:CheY-like chemotaxis protein